LYRVLQSVMTSDEGAGAAALRLPAPWPAVPNLTELEALIREFIVETAEIEDLHMAGVIQQVVEDVRSALQHRSRESLEQALSMVIAPSEGHLLSPLSLANAFKAFLRLRSYEQLQSQPNSSSSASASHPHQSGSSSASGREGVPTAGTTAGIRDTTAIEEFALAAQSMGGRFFGAWRAFSLGRSIDYGQRHGVHYFKPNGWIKRRLLVENFDEIRDWPIVYHGSQDDRTANILLSGLRNPGTHGVTGLHGQAHGTGRTIYLSPSIYYSSHPVYAPLHPLQHGRRWFQIVLQCKIRPGSWRVRGNTLGSRHWPRDVCFDPNLPSNDHLEFLVEDASAVVVIGLMYRELGCDADASKFGELVRLIRPEDADRSQYRWTEILAEDHRRRDLILNAARAGA